MTTNRIRGKHEGTTVADIMTSNPLTISASETVGQASDLMSEYRIRQLPVVREHELVGILTDRDMRSFLDAAILADPQAREKALATEVQEIMTTNPLVLSPDDDLQEAIELLIEEKIGGIPV